MNDSKIFRKWPTIPGGQKILWGLHLTFLFAILFNIMIPSILEQFTLNIYIGDMLLSVIRILSMIVCIGGPVLLWMGIKKLPPANKKALNISYLFRGAVLRIIIAGSYFLCSLLPKLFFIYHSLPAIPILLSAFTMSSCLLWYYSTDINRFRTAMLIEVILGTLHFIWILIWHAIFNVYLPDTEAMEALTPYTTALSILIFLGYLTSYVLSITGWRNFLTASGNTPKV